MDESHSGFTFDDNYYNVGQLPHINSDNNSFNFSSSFVDDTSLNAGDSFFVKIHGENEVLHNVRHTDTRNINEIKSEPIKFELNDVNIIQNSLGHSRASRSNSNSGAQEEQKNNVALTTNTLRYPICFKCEKCMFVSISQSGVEAHISQFHSNTFQENILNRKKILCPGCENVFYVKHSLEVHLEYDHLMNKNEIQKVVDRVISSSNSPETSDNRKSRIFLKNVDFLCNPPSGRGEEDNCNETHYTDLIDLINDSHENSNDCQQISDDLRDIVPISEDEVTLNPNESIEYNPNSLNKHFGDLSSSVTLDIQPQIMRPSSPCENGEKRRRPKIYIKNVDILKEPIFVPTNNFTNVLNVNADLSTLALFPPPSGNHMQHSYIKDPNQLPSNSVPFDEHALEVTKKKIYIKNVDVLRGEHFYETPKKSGNSLHLRTVDELNLMNKNEVQNLFNPILDQNCSNGGVNIPSSENSKNSDEVGIVNYNTPPDVEYNRNNSFLENEDDVMQMNWTNDYGFDGLENIIDSSSSATSGDQKNPHFDLNTPQRSITDDNDKDMLFVCAQEIINTNNSTNQENDIVSSVDIEKQPDLNLCLNTSLPNMEAEEVVEILDDLEKQQPIQDDVVLIPEKGRIYVADNLMEDGKSSEEIKKKPRGRPLGSKRTWVTMIKPRNKKATTEIGYKCDQNCGMRFLKLETLEIHKQCHVSSSPQRMQCPVCKSTNYNSWDTLHTHLWRNHQIDMDLYSCQHCDFKTPILSRLINTHSKIHSDERNFKCEQCSKTFKNSKQLKNHRRTHRLPSAGQTNEIHRCESCGSAFSQIKSLRAHICKEKEHDRELFSCTACGKVASTKSSWKQHLLTHQDASKFKCEHCNYVTNDHNSYRRHKIIHDNSKMYSCKFCDYKCIQSNLYQKHVLKTHPTEADQVIFKCPTCSFSTINHGKYNVHIAKHGDAAIQADDSQDNNNHVKDCVTFTSPSAPIQPESNLNSKIKVKSGLLLTDPNRFITSYSSLLQNSLSDIT